MPPVGMFSKITWGQCLRMAVGLSVGTLKLCLGWPQQGSPGCAGSSDVQWQQPGSPKSPEHLKHPCTTLYRCWVLNSEVLELCCYIFVLIYRLQGYSWWYSHQRVTLGQMRQIGLFLHSALLKSQPFGTPDFILDAHQWCALSYKYYLFLPLLTDTTGQANEHQSLHSSKKVWALTCVRCRERNAPKEPGLWWMILPAQHGLAPVGAYIFHPKEL